MKTEPMQHQLEARGRLANHQEYYALAAEQGTGKTWMVLDDVEQQLGRGIIDALLVIAPKGVHSNWVRREIPRHMSAEVQAGYYLAGAGKRHTEKLNRLLRPVEDGELAVLTMNVDALNTKKGRELAHAFLKRHRAMMAIDESQRIKNPQAARSKHAISLSGLARSRRIASGTIITESPLDAFGQYQFLKNGLLGTTSYRSFVAEYAELLPEHHPIAQQAAQRARRGRPQIIKTDERGRKVFRNMDKLKRIIAPYTYRVLKKDCLDLPEKIYKVLPFELPPNQRRQYDQLKEDMRYERSSGHVDTFNAMTLINKLRQAASGFIMLDGEATALSEDNARLAALLDALEDIPGQVAIWASFQEEIRQIKRALGDDAVTYYGETKDADREAAVDAFQSGRARYFIGHPRAGGTGLTLTAAETVIYYSNEYSLESRLQSEDRHHRIGTRNNVVYIDLAAARTVDEKIADSLQAKYENALEVLDFA